jgi:pimeloyl-ACP methyl ester carboxylesterase
MGRASHWAGTARWLGERRRAVALDQRGHGQSEAPAGGPYTRDAFVRDAEAVIEGLGIGPVVLIGEDDAWVERPSPARGEFFAEVMTETADGWRPVFSRRQMLMARETWVYDAHWEELGQVRCPTLVVRGLDGELGRAEAQEMVRVLPLGAYAEIPDAGHLVHWDQPAAWRAAVEPFLASLPAPVRE